jgi:hypothetical protein
MIIYFRIEGLVPCELAPRRPVAYVMHDLLLLLRISGAIVFIRRTEPAVRPAHARCDTKNMFELDFCRIHRSGHSIDPRLGIIAPNEERQARCQDDNVKCVLHLNESPLTGSSSSMHGRDLQWFAMYSPHVEHVGRLSSIEGGDMTKILSGGGGDGRSAGFMEEHLHGMLSAA